MLASFIASRITGTYSFLFVPLLLPTSYAAALLPPHLQLLPNDENDAPSTSTFKSSTLKRPSTPEGYAWVVVVAGEQKGTGMSVPGGRSTFFEAKLEIPYVSLVDPPCSTSTPPKLTHKQTLLFSSWSMALSSDRITGLRSHHAEFQVEEEEHGVMGDYEVKDWMRLERRDAEAEAEAAGGIELPKWREDVVREEITGWWVGERTGAIATRFTMDPNHPPTRLERIKVRLNLAQFAHQSIEQVQAHFTAKEANKIDDQGWYEVEASGWQCEERTAMKATRLAEL
ncbi:BZ3500_MvSof-1268-A1-R1_Chr1-3g02055 [Microbotryum saponariae]|uniref:BZ3500_MvSof-1268-A1-R1_Chr1-3g02055 protein n=1 Tax=Microbotryum saponariae TaxID=289078 RepID=A0A2X0KHZ6_9BASI|nr:BZ3500_MvSof-1268-A1-R1_Chr1-3g02055 [Microbotryum saponariae]SCZ95274.1 BZ3501_MvSof-1269-A2-R1_Chr1-3g01657 [Microbotryum saponariae]